MNNPDIGKLILRLSLGFMIILHGIHKLMHGVGWIAGMLSSSHLPGFFAYGVYIGEVVAPIMIILGLYTRIGAGLIVINMLVALALVHHSQIFHLNDHGGWMIELQAFYLFTALAICFLGPGKYKLKN